MPRRVVGFMNQDLKTIEVTYILLVYIDKLLHLEGEDYDDMMTSTVKLTRALLSCFNPSFLQHLRLHIYHGGRGVPWVVQPSRAALRQRISLSGATRTELAPRR